MANIQNDIQATSDAVKVETDLIGTIVNAGGTATLGAVLGDMANSPIVTRLGNIQTAIDTVDDFVDTEITALQTSVTALAAGGGIGTAVARKSVTFANTAADVNLFTVTGTVIARLIAVCDTNVASAAGCNIGVDAGTTALIADTDCTLLLQGELWNDASPDAMVELTSTVKEYIVSNSTTIVLDVEAAKQVDSGAITFVCFYTPVTSNGAVAAA